MPKATGKQLSTEKKVVFKNGMVSSSSYILLGKMASINKISASNSKFENLRWGRLYLALAMVRNAYFKFSASSWRRLDQIQICWERQGVRATPPIVWLHWKIKIVKISKSSKFSVLFCGDRFETKFFSISRIHEACLSYNIQVSSDDTRLLEEPPVVDVYSILVVRYPRMAWLCGLLMMFLFIIYG